MFVLINLMEGDSHVRAFYVYAASAHFFQQCILPFNIS